MLIYVFGGTASGKSGIAEEVACGFSGERVYLATMENLSRESGERIAKHRAMRKGKGFVTIEKQNALSELELSEKVILLECVSNLLANTMFDGESVQDVEYCVKTVMSDIRHLQKRNDLIVVGNDVFGDDIFSDKEYSETVQNYIDALSRIHERLIRESERCIEVVCGIAICRHAK